MAALAAELIRFVVPAACIACRRWLPIEASSPLTCPTCRSRLKPAPWPRCRRCHYPLGTGRPQADVCRECRGWDATLTRARFAYVLASPADALVHGLKYEGWSALAVEMGAPVARAVRPEVRPGERTLVVPVPTTRKRLRERGYNQAGILAAEVSRNLAIPFVEALIRTRGGTTQVALHPSQRRANVSGVFAPRRPSEPRVRGAHVVLVDDVLTTGATGVAAATTLSRMGADTVTLATFVRALPSAPVAR